MNRFGFLKQFVTNPIKTGAIAPSSRSLSIEMVERAGVRNADVILEFGTGTGVMTEEICKTKSQRSNFIGFEINDRFAKATQRRCPTAEILNLSASEAPRVLDDMRLDGCDSVVSGLPWAAFSSQLQDQLMGAVMDVLRPGGIFVTFAYIHSLIMASAHRFHQTLKGQFQQVSRSSIGWGTLPPALVYIAVK